MKAIIINAVVSLAIAVSVVMAKDYVCVKDVGTPVAVINYDVVAAGAKLGHPEQAEGGYAKLSASATKLAAAGFVVIDSRALAAYPPDLEVPSPVDQEPEAEGVRDE